MCSCTHSSLTLFTRRHDRNKHRFNILVRLYDNRRIFCNRQVAACALNLASKTLISDYTTAYSATRLFSAMMYY